MKPKKLAVLDTCVVLSFLFGEPKGAVDGDEKHKRSKGEIQALVKEGYQIGVPLIVPAEVTSSKHADAVKDGWPVAGERYKMFMEFLEDSVELLVMEADSGIAIKAAEVGAEAPLKAPDALILASALEYRAEVLISWDGKLLKKGPMYDLETRKPLIRGDQTLFDEYPELISGSDTSPAA